MRFAQIQWIGLLLVQYVLANTESIVVELHSDADGLVVPGTSWEGQFDDWSNNASRVQIPLQAPAGKYFVMVCWPASEPANFDLQWEEPNIIVSAARNVIPLKRVDPVVRFTLSASRMVYGLPDVAWVIIPRIAIVIAVGAIMAAAVWRGVFVI